ncbi:dihydrodipicolinate synthase family protein [Pararcticibacter amylolyticus]|uniref:Dihydrodipicolinate synthase family protein n=1 Tax=Pararcticibacter amylolyticus TaxID=2173175 RepID=A0A2U2PEB1_9SPHI|nr:dihydrodipicolinate synthase family protein [Pararcticibacter amylolyticus]PWG79713.1 dihydrodipicolinate synthase family protein [Pararcticibacter amylolyticus]
MENKKKGFIPVMLTPFKDNGEIDYNILTELTEIYLEAGASGLFANCLSSEMFELTDKERLDAIKHVIKVVDGKVPVVATGTFGGEISKQADFVKRVHDTGTQAVIMISSLLAGEKESDAVFNERVFELLHLTPGIPLGFYECPVPYKRLLSAEQLKSFVDTGRVIYHKDTCLDIDQIKAKLAATESYPEFGLYDAYMVHAVESLKAGSKGLSCIQGNYFPELIVWLCDHYNDASLQDEVQKVQQFLIDNMDVMHNVYPVVSKYFLQKRGLNISTFTRRKVGEFTNSITREIETLFQNYTNLQQELDLKLAIS